MKFESRFDSNKWVSLQNSLPSNKFSVSKERGYPFPPLEDKLERQLRFSNRVLPPSFVTEAVKHKTSNWLRCLRSSPGAKGNPDLARAGGKGESGSKHLNRIPRRIDVESPRKPIIFSGRSQVQGIFCSSTSRGTHPSQLKASFLPQVVTPK